MTRSLIAACCLFSLANAAWIARAAEPAAIGTNMGVQIDLKTELQKGLKARRPCEFQYIDQLTTMIEADQLPRSLVDSTFIWARKQPTRQLQYFQFALKARADRYGFATPNLENQFVSPFTGKLPRSSTFQASPPSPPKPPSVTTSAANTIAATTAAIAAPFNQTAAATKAYTDYYLLQRLSAPQAKAALIQAYPPSETGLSTFSLSRIFSNRLTSVLSNP
jgi:hypothetical protein